jgi:hypothetical protein
MRLYYKTVDAVMGGSSAFVASEFEGEGGVFLPLDREVVPLEQTLPVALGRCQPPQDVCGKRGAPSVFGQSPLEEPQQEQQTKETSVLGLSTQESPPLVTNTTREAELERLIQEQKNEQRRRWVCDGESPCHISMDCLPR